MAGTSWGGDGGELSQERLWGNTLNALKFMVSGVPGRPRVQESGRGLYRAGQAQLGAAIGPRRNEMEIEKLLRQFYSHYPLHVREVIGNREGEGQ